MRRTIEILALVSFTCMVAPVAAQDRQTSAGANLFLQTALKDVPINGPDSGNYYYREFKPGSRDGCVLNARIADADGKSRWLEHDFAQTLEVRVIGDWVRETRKLNSDAIELTYDIGSKAMAGRVLTAIEFLRKHCDKAAGTGF